MVQATAYPSCCGALVFTGFSGEDERVRQEFINCCRNSNNRMKWSFVLNDRQVQNLPLTLAEAHRVGFVLSNSWVNFNHNSQLYEFERCGERVTLNSAARKIDWVGRVLTPNLGGPVANDPLCLLTDVTADNTRHLGGAAPVNMPAGLEVNDYLRTTRDTTAHGFGVGSIIRITSGHAANRIIAQGLDSRGRYRSAYVNIADAERVIYRGGGVAGFRRYPAEQDINVGDTVRVSSPTGRNHLRELTVLRIVRRDYDGDIAVLDGNTPDAREDQRGEQRVVISRCRKVNIVAPDWVADWETAPPRDVRPAPAFQPAFQEINLVDGEEQWRAVRPERNAENVREVRVEVPVPVQRESLVTSYHARYRDGRVGAGYDSLVALREANPRVSQYIRRDIFNTAPHVVNQNPQEMPR